MTKKELVEELKGMPDDAIICVHSQFGDDRFEINSVDYEEDEHYFDIEDEPKKGNIITI